MSLGRFYDLGQADQDMRIDGYFHGYVGYLFQTYGQILYVHFRVQKYNYVYFGYLRTQTISCFDPSGLGLNKKPCRKRWHQPNDMQFLRPCVLGNICDQSRYWQMVLLKMVHFSGNLKPSGVKWENFIQK